ncbi:MAG: universal stress protein UspA [Proteobacteria bacterium]|nr:MAG: universal stress protein UspA [Pseudomonadota bacterium]
MDFTKITGAVVPVDLSEPSFAALRAALGLVDANAVRLVHVIRPFSRPEHEGIWGHYDNEQHARDVTLQIQCALESRGIGSMPVDIHFGSPGPLICEYAERIDAQLIVIGSHGRTGLKRIMMGSVAETVVRHAPCSVLVVRSDAE